jgi:hypothetical protein
VNIYAPNSIIAEFSKAVYFTATDVIIHSLQTIRSIFTAVPAAMPSVSATAGETVYEKKDVCTDPEKTLFSARFSAAFIRLLSV